MRKLKKFLITGTLLGLGITLVFEIIRLVLGQPFRFDMSLLSDLGYTLLYSWVLTLVNGSFFDYLNEQVKWKKYARYRYLIGALGGITLTMMAIALLRVTIEMGIGGENWTEFVQGEQPSHYFVALLITLVISGAFHAFYFYKHWQERKVTEQKIIAGTASARFDALKNQLDPHFLFNSLNVLTSLIEEDPAKAQGFTTSLSKVYRYVLEQKNKELVPVEEELQFARTYGKLLKMRFEEGLHFEIPDRAENPEALIVPLSLQLLLENAVKHNVVTSRSPLIIKVKEEENALIVANKLQVKKGMHKGSGVGLRNIRERYRLLTDRQVVIRSDSEEFRVHLPILTQQVSVNVSQEEYLRDKRYQKARERVENIKGFYGNLFAYCLVIPFLAWLNLRSTSFPWAIFPALGWGIGLLAHGLSAFGKNPFWGPQWEERKIKELMEQEDF